MLNLNAVACRLTVTAQLAPAASTTFFRVHAASTHASKRTLLHISSILLRSVIDAVSSPPRFQAHISPPHCSRHIDRPLPRPLATAAARCYAYFYPHLIVLLASSLSLPYCNCTSLFTLLPQIAVFTPSSRSSYYRALAIGTTLLQSKRKAHGNVSATPG